MYHIGTRASLPPHVVQVIEEALGRPREQQTRREQMEVAEILGFSFPVWEQSPGKRRFGSYEPQRAFVKTGSGRRVAPIARTAG